MGLFGACVGGLLVWGGLHSSVSCGDCLVAACTECLVTGVAAGSGLLDRLPNVGPA